MLSSFVSSYPITYQLIILSYPTLSIPSIILSYLILPSPSYPPLSIPSYPIILSYPRHPSLSQPDTPARTLSHPEPPVQTKEPRKSLERHAGNSKQLGIASVSERLRRWTRNPLGSARRGSNPLAVVFHFLSSSFPCAQVFPSVQQEPSHSSFATTRGPFS